MKKTSKRIVIKKYEIKEILPILSKDFNKSSKVELEGYKVRNGTSRLRVFKLKGCTCVSCKLKAEYFLLEFRDEKASAPHLSLYGERNGEKILFTQDHTKPLSKGGTGKIENLQTMCCKCNTKKGNKYEGKKKNNFSFINRCIAFFKLHIKWNNKGLKKNEDK